MWTLSVPDTGDGAAWGTCGGGAFCGAAGGGGLSAAAAACCAAKEDVRKSTAYKGSKQVMPCQDQLFSLRFQSRTAVLQ